MKKILTALLLCFILMCISLGCSSVNTKENMLEERPPDGRYTVIVFYDEDTSIDLNRMREALSGHYKIQKSEFRGGGADNKSELFEVTSFPTFIVIGHEGITLRTDNLQDVIDYFGIEESAPVK